MDEILDAGSLEVFAAGGSTGNDVHGASVEILESRDCILSVLIVAGAPACSDDLKAAGIENFINVKSNQLETLRAYNAKLGI